MDRDFPFGPVVSDPSCSALQVSSVPGWGTWILQAAEWLGPHATTTEDCVPQLENSCIARKIPHDAMKI